MPGAVYVRGCLECGVRCDGAYCKAHESVCPICSARIHRAEIFCQRCEMAVLKQRAAFFPAV